MFWTIKPNEIFLIISLILLTIEIRQYNQFYLLMENNRLKPCPFQALCNCILGNYSQSPAASITSRTYTRDESSNLQHNKQLILFDCKSIPIYKFPDIPYVQIDRLVIHGSEITNLEFESLSSFRIQSLILSHNRIQTIYSKSFSLSESSLVQLDLSYNRLQTIPFGALLNLKSLNFLNLDSNEIESIFGNWPQFHGTLRSLSLARNEIDRIQRPSSLSQSFAAASSSLENQDFRELEHLQWLNLDGNRIRELTTHTLPNNLETLSLAQNHFEHFPFGLFHLRHLKWIVFKDNYLTGFNHEFRSVQKTQIWIEKLDLAENFIDSFPNVTVGQQTNMVLTNPLIVRDLNLSYNEITDIGTNDFRFLKCDRLLLGHNHITKFADDSLVELTETLTYFDLDHNELNEIPKSFRHLKSLKYLYLSSNRLGNLKSSIETLAGSLKVLSLSNNFLRSIPACTNLTYLNLGYNEIYRLSATTGGCLQLKTLLLHNNRLIELRRDQFIKFPNLQELNLSFNPIRVVDTGIFANLTALKSLEMAFIELLDENNSGFFRNLRAIKWLLLDNNGFREIPDAIAQLPHLQYLNFEWNRLVRLPKFRATAELKDLRLSYNFVNELHGNEFESLTSLRAIFLNGNRLVDVKRGQFHGLDRLQLILLCDNLLRRFDKLSFFDLPHLKLLSLQRNRLTSFNFEIFHNVSTGTLDGNGLVLNLSRNSISQCPYSVRNPVDLTVNIAKIDFSYNRFRDWPPCLSFVRFSLIELRLQSNEIVSLYFNDESNSSNQKFISLQQIDLRRNRIAAINRDFFHNFPHLQVADLSENHMKSLHSQQFQINWHLKWLNLSSNVLVSIPKDIFSFSKFEMIDLSANRLNAIPKSAINVISLKSLNLCRNFIDFLDSTMLWKLLNLETLSLCDNRMTVLADNVFSNMAKLRHLNLNGNSIRANFKELFHYAHNLYELDFARNNLTTLPLLPLPNLIKLNLAHNQIDDVSLGSIEMLAKLKHLILSFNRLKIVPKHIWQYFPHLKFLDLSGNYFKNLNRLTSLHLTNLNYVQHFAGDVFESVANSLKTVRIGNFANYYRSINQNKWCHTFLKPLKYLRELEIHETSANIRQLHLTRHLFDCLDNGQQQRKKITKLVLHGNSITKIERDLFDAFANNIRLEIEITHTNINELPVGLFSQLNRIGRLKIALRHNRLLTFLSPETFYANASAWEKIGTKLLSDGLMLENQSWQCGCHLAWLSHWYRRWIHESLQLYNQSPENVLETYESLMQITCLNLAKNTIANDDADADNDDRGVSQNDHYRIPVINLMPDEMQCQASALNFTNSMWTPTGVHYSFLILLLILCL